MALVTVSSARCRRTSTPSDSGVNQATFIPASTACCPRASSRKVFKVPAGPQTNQVFLAVHPFQRAQGLLGGGGHGGQLGVPKVLTVGKAAPGAAGGQRGAVRDLLAVPEPDDADALRKVGGM
jgi:hypothetical protein